MPVLSEFARAAPEDLLDVGDKTSSILSLLVALVALGVAIRYRPDSRREHTRRLRGPRSTVFVACTVAFVAAVSAAALLYLADVPTPLVLGLAGLAVALLVVSLVLVVGLARSTRPSAINPRSPLGRLLSAQDQLGSQHRYTFAAGHVAALDSLYVELSAAAAPTTDRPVPRRTPVPAMLSRRANALVVGVAGAGKSSVGAAAVATSARWWCTARGGEAPYGANIPLVVDAALLRTRSVEAALVVAVRDQVGTEFPQALFLAPPGPGLRWLVIVDGLDEIVGRTERSEVLWRLKRLMTTAPGHLRIMVMTRPLPAPEERELRDVPHERYELLPLDDAGMHEFATRWFGTDTPAEGARPPAEEYLDFVDRSELASVVRIPLVATLAAITFRTVPHAVTSRTELYRRFVDVCLRTPSALMEPGGEHRAGPAGDPFETVLSRAAEDQVRGVAGPLATLLQACATEVLVAQGTAPDVADHERVRRRALDSGLVRATRDGIEFVHRSVAEYLAAGVRTFSVATWRSEMQDPTRRSLALFTIARQPLDVVRSVLADALDGDEDGVVAVTWLLVDGHDVGPELARATSVALLAALSRPTGGFEKIEAAILLAERRPGYADLLRERVETGDLPPWTTALLADRLLRSRPDHRRHLLSTLLRDPNSSRALRTWVAEKLESEGDAYAALVLAFRLIDHDPAGGEPSRPVPTGQDDALRHTAASWRLADTRREVRDRFRAAVELFDDGRHDVLNEIVALAREEGCPPLTRFEIGRWLADVSPADGAGVLDALVEAPAVPEPIARDAAAVLLENGFRPRTARLVELGTEPVLRDHAVRAYAAMIVELGAGGDGVTLSALMERPDAPADLRLAAARALMRGGRTDEARGGLRAMVRGAAAVTARTGAIALLSEASRGALDLAELADDRRVLHQLRWFCLTTLKPLDPVAAGAVLEHMIDRGEAGEGAVLSTLALFAAGEVLAARPTLLPRLMPLLDRASPDAVWALARGCEDSGGLLLVQAIESGRASSYVARTLVTGLAAREVPPIALLRRIAFAGPESDFETSAVALGALVRRRDRLVPALLRELLAEASGRRRVRIAIEALPITADYLRGFPSRGPDDDGARSPQEPPECLDLLADLCCVDGLADSLLGEAAGRLLVLDPHRGAVRVAARLVGGDAAGIDTYLVAVEKALRYQPRLWQRLSRSSLDDETLVTALDAVMRSEPLYAARACTLVVLDGSRGVPTRVEAARRLVRLPRRADGVAAVAALQLDAAEAELAPDVRSELDAYVASEEPAARAEPSET